MPSDTNDFDAIAAEINNIVAEYRADLKDSAGKARIHAERIAAYLALIPTDKARNVKNIQFELSSLASLASVIASKSQTRAAQFQNSLIAWAFNFIFAALDAAL